MTSRRAFLAGLPAAAAMVTLPASAAVDNLSIVEDAAERIDRLMNELSDALADYCGGQFRAIVEPSSLPNGMVLLQGMHTDAILQRFGKNAPAPPAAAGLAVMNIGNRWVSIDTAALPQQLTVIEEDTRTAERPDGVAEHVSMPERGAEYAVVTHDGRIVLTPLVEGLGSPWRRDCRLGFMPGSAGQYRVHHAVTVLGRVISEG
jgi:hypothetical protein